jgi:hypothetical protein
MRVALRATLQKLWECMDSSQDAEVLAELKRTVLLRMAELDAAEALKVVKNADTAVGAVVSEELPRRPAA